MVNLKPAAKNCSKKWINMSKNKASMINLSVGKKMITKTQIFSQQNDNEVI